MSTMNNNVNNYDRQKYVHIYTFVYISIFVSKYSERIILY